jgi:hypothetical protein
MNNITIIEQPQLDGSIVEIVEIAHADGSFTSMPKAVYEAQQVEHLTEIPTK